ncbi:MAG: hypothetical protein HQK77_07080 [Desulfobacterales bacterium]|nr:hypothetical protein [Desulfobacterales bacterium]
MQFDDSEYVLDNVMVLQGLTLEGFIWAWTTFHSCNWHPITWLSHMLDCNLYGLNPVGHHMTSLFFHVFNTHLLFYFIQRTTHQSLCAFMIAMIFGLHPIHVESVAWIAERKDVLSTSFFLLGLIGYDRYVRTHKMVFYLLTFLCFICGLLSKPMVITFPCVLLLVDIWPLKRIESHVMISKLMKEKIPFIVVSIISAGITLYAQTQSGVVQPFSEITFTARIVNASISLVGYVFKFINPCQLAVFYPHAGSAFEWIDSWKPILLIALVVVFSWNQAKQKPFIFVGLLWYGITFIPVSGVIQVGIQSMADRYMYIPSIGISIAFIFGIVGFLKHVWIQRIVLAGFMIWCIVLGNLTHRQIRYWENTLSLFSHAIEVNQHLCDQLLHPCLLTYMGCDVYQEAILKNQTFIELVQYTAKLSVRTGTHLMTMGQPSLAMKYFDQAINLCKSHTGACLDTLTMARKNMEILRTSCNQQR